MLEVSNIDVAYGQSQIIHDLTLSAKPGETVAIVGRNGMGKTTLMKSLIGILKNRRGKISVGGKDVSRMDSFKRVQNGLAFVPQGRQIFPLLTVEENIRTGLETANPRKIDDSIYAMFPVLKDMRKRKGGNLSGGQQQQLAIARALVSRPKVLLLDEPTEGIQPSIIKDIARALNEIKRVHNLAVLVSEQVLSFALDVADRILVMESGRLVHQVPRKDADRVTIAKYLAV